MSEEDKKIKVTDKRMFTSSGELREEFREIGSGERREASPAPSRPEPEPSTPIVGAGASAAPETKEEFFMLLEMLAQGAAYYLQQSQVAGPEMQQHREAARQHLDLLGVLKEKTEGNRSAEETSALDDTLYRLRMALMDERG